MCHTVLLLQTGDASTKTYIDYETVQECIKGIRKIYEYSLAAINPGIPVIRYDVDTLLQFIDLLPDISCLVHNNSIDAYKLYTKDWIKEKLIMLLTQDIANDAEIELPN